MLEKVKIKNINKEDVRQNLRCSSILLSVKSKHQAGNKRRVTSLKENVADLRMKKLTLSGLYRKRSEPEASLNMPNVKKPVLLTN